MDAAGRRMKDVEVASYIRSNTILEGSGGKGIRYI
jgi:hypothetical protein